MLRDLLPTLEEWSFVQGEEDPRRLPGFDELPEGCVLEPSVRAFRASAATAPPRQQLAADAQRTLQAVFTAGNIAEHAAVPSIPSFVRLFVRCWFVCSLEFCSLTLLHAVV